MEYIEIDNRHFFSDCYGNVYEKYDSENHFFCSINGRTLRQAIINNLLEEEMEEEALLNFNFTERNINK
ncbi:MAG: hypothetical protein ACUZ8H_14005 [Candidatus Anammoxibacter sp.]